MKRGGFLYSFLAAVAGTTVADLTKRLWKTLGRAALYVFAGAAVYAYVWWQAQPRWVHVIIVLALLALVLRVPLKTLERPRKGNAPRRRGNSPTDPEEFLYRWYEPDDLPDGETCYCGKPRIPGELVYVGITNNPDRRARDQDRRDSCWWRVELVGEISPFMTRAEVERAEKHAIKVEKPRENIAHAGSRR